MVVHETSIRVCKLGYFCIYHVSVDNKFIKYFYNMSKTEKSCGRKVIYNVYQCCLAECNTKTILSELDNVYQKNVCTNLFYNLLSASFI